MPDDRSPIMRAVDVYDTARLGHHGQTPSAGGMSEANKQSIAPMIQAAIDAYNLSTASREASFVPGKMRCAKCGFTLLRKTLYMKSGTVGPGDNETEPCPNRCGPLWPQTWKQEAEELGELLEQTWKEKQEIIARRDERVATLLSACRSARELIADERELIVRDHTIAGDLATMSASEEEQLLPFDEALAQIDAVLVESEEGP
jgi:hypothetical protein